jgi:hypothetical protein
MIQISSHGEEEERFVEFRRKVRSAEVLSASIERLLHDLRFTGRLSVILQNGRVLKSGYEEGYFRKIEPYGTSRLQ